MIPFLAALFAFAIGAAVPAVGWYREQPVRAPGWYRERQASRREVDRVTSTGADWLLDAEAKMREMHRTLERVTGATITVDLIRKGEDREAVLRCVPKAVAETLIDRAVIPMIDGRPLYFPPSERVRGVRQ